MENEEMAVFKSYLRNLLRILEQLKKELDDGEHEKAAQTLEKLIRDTKSGIED